MSKASAGRRERRLTKKKQLGRPSGTPASLFKDRQRFAIAAWIALMPDYGPHDTARFVTVLIEEDTPIQLEDIEGLRLVLSAGYKAPASATLDEYAMALSRKAKLVRGRATGSELEWLGASASALRVLVLSFLHDDLPGMRRQLDILRNAGWGKTSERVGRRLAAALKSSNIPPRDDPVGPNIRRALNALRREQSSQAVDKT